jgi:hypothetical protein
VKGKLTAYGIVSILGYIIRNAVLPNPFECFGEKAFLINLIAEPIIHLLAFIITGMFYEKGSFPVLGSILYLVFYCAIIGILWLLGLASFAWWSIVIAIVAIVGIGVLFFWICESQEEYD